LFVRLKEKFSKTFVDHYILAEKGYEKELTFLPKRTTVLENKLGKSAVPLARSMRADAEHINLLFSGTIAKTTGVFKAIEIAEALHAVDNKVSLTIIGYCAQAETLREIHHCIQNKPFIELVGGHVLVPHSDILRAICEADLGIIAYPLHASTMNSIPTKLFEYLGYELPILLIDHKPWVDICADYPAAVVFDPARLDAVSILTSFKSRHFYSTKPTNVFWSTEEPRFRQLISSLTTHFAV
jgi:hypothetical protein